MRACMVACYTIAIDDFNNHCQYYGGALAPLNLETIATSASVIKNMVARFNNIAK